MSNAREVARAARSFGGGNTPTTRNYIINGDFQVWQRGTSFPYSAFGGAGFCADRFWFYNGGGATAGTVERSADVPVGQGFAYSLFNNTNGNMPSGTNVELTTPGLPAPFSIGETYVLSFWVKGASASTNNTVQVEWRNSHANGANGVGANAQLLTYAVTTEWTRVEMPVTLSGTPYVTNAVLDFEWNHKAGAKITGVKLEDGSVATPFEHRPYGTELALCQRYFEKSYPQGVAPGSNTTEGIVGNCAPNTAAYTGEVPGGSFLYQVEKRAVPSVVIYDRAGNPNKCTRLRPEIAWYDNQSISSLFSYSAKTINFTSPSGSAASGMFCHFTASAEL